MKQKTEHRTKTFSEATEHYFIRLTVIYHLGATLFKIADIIPHKFIYFTTKSDAPCFRRRKGSFQFLSFVERWDVAVLGVATR